MVLKNGTSYKWSSVLVPQQWSWLKCLAWYKLSMFDGEWPASNQSPGCVVHSASKMHVRAATEKQEALIKKLDAYYIRVLCRFWEGFQKYMILVLEGGGSGVFSFPDGKNPFNSAFFESFPQIYVIILHQWESDMYMKSNWTINQVS